MEYTIIKVRCIDQALIPTVAPTIAAGGVLEDKVIFEFCPLWDGFIKTAVFWLDKGEPYEAALDAENSCVIPFEALTNAGHMFFGVYGINADGVKRTSEVIKYKIVQGAIEGVEHGEPTPDIYEQLLERLAQIEIGEGGGAGTFIAEYGVTTSAEVIAAFNSGRRIVCKHDVKYVGYVYAELQFYVDDMFFFLGPVVSSEEDKLVYYTLDEADGWEQIDLSLVGGSGTVSEEQLATAIESYFAENPVVGTPGKDGDDGVSVTKVEQTTTSTADSGTNVITVTLSDGQTFNFNVKNGSKGSKGDTPVKGVDYYTDADKAEIVEELADASPVRSVNGKTGVVSLSANDVGARANTWLPTLSDIGAEKSGTASSAVSAHNTNETAHNDIRLLIEGLTTRLNALANSTDEDLDQMAEVVAYIKSNKQLIDSITTSKVSVADIVNNLTTNVSNKPLSAAQGVALKALIDAITVPTKVSELTNDKGYLTSFTETDPTVPSWAKQSTKPSYTKSEVGLANVDNVKQYSASNPPPYPVTSVNGQTGAVTVSVPTKTSQLTNDSNFLTQHQSLSGYAKTADHYTKTESDNKYQPKGNYLTSHQDISGKADKSSAETWTFTLEDGSTVTKKVVLA